MNVKYKYFLLFICHEIFVWVDSHIKLACISLSITKQEFRGDGRLTSGRRWNVLHLSWIHYAAYFHISFILAFACTPYHTRYTYGFVVFRFVFVAVVYFLNGVMSYSNPYSSGLLQYLWRHRMIQNTSEEIRMLQVKFVSIPKLQRCSRWWRISWHIFKGMWLLIH